MLSLSTRTSLFSPCVERIRRREYGQILVVAVTAVTEDEYGLEAPCLGPEICLHRVSSFRNYRENVALARLLARYWHENPKRLARVLDELEIWLNVREDVPTASNGGGS